MDVCQVYFPVFKDPSLFPDIKYQDIGLRRAGQAHLGNTPFGIKFKQDAQTRTEYMEYFKKEEYKDSQRSIDVNSTSVFGEVQFRHVLIHELAHALAQGTKGIMHKRMDYSLSYEDITESIAQEAMRYLDLKPVDFKDMIELITVAYKEKVKVFAPLFAMIEDEVFKFLATQNEIAAFKHEGFWEGMNTFKDTQKLNEIWEKGEAKWKKW